MSFLPKILYLCIIFFIPFLFFCAGSRAGNPQELKVGEKKWFWSDSERVFPFEARCKIVASGCWTRLFSSTAVSQRPTLAVRGEVITMTASSQDSIPSSMASLFLLLLLPAAFTQNFAVPTTPTASLFDPLTQPECMKKEHPKVSIQGQTSLITTCFVWTW